MNESVSSPDTPRRLLEAGRRLFGRHGFDGTSVRALTSEAGVNLGAVTYHFGSKAALYRAVLRHVFSPVRDLFLGLGDVPEPPMERVERVVRGMFRILAANPDLPRFFIRELVLGDRPSPETVDTAGAVLGILSSILEEGQRDGSVVAGDTVLQALTVMSQPIYLTLMSTTLARRDLGHAELPSPTRPAEDHAVRSLRRALLTREEETR